MKQNVQQQFETIVATILSTTKVEPEIIRQHISKYAQDNGLSYELAKQAVILTVNYRIAKKIEQL